MENSADYNRKKSFFDKVLTVYGRKAVLETLQDNSLECHSLHLAHSNRESGIVAEIRQHAVRRGVPIKSHDREALSRISKNGRQDQGVAIDIICPSFATLEQFLALKSTQPRRVLALDGITNPQNLGMIVRSAAAGAIDGILLPRKGSAALGPLVIKASAGTLYRAPLVLCSSLAAALASCQQHGGEVCTLESDAPTSLFQHNGRAFCVYVLGNETDGVSAQIRAMADTRLSIPMRNGVESLNVAVTASLIAYGTYLDR
tara:strand:+ start:2537 stop:3313 length:777 start_codon:yes stop_codon:yes gene_type:complete